MHFKINPFGEVKRERENSVCAKKCSHWNNLIGRHLSKNEARELVAPRSSRIFCQNITLEKSADSMAQKFLLSSRIFIPISWRKQRNSYFKIKIWFKMLKPSNAVIISNEFCRWTLKEKDENVFKDFGNLKRCCHCCRTTHWVNKQMPRTANRKQKSTFSHWLDLLFCLQYVIEYDNFLFFYFDSQWACVCVCVQAQFFRWN